MPESDPENKGLYFQPSYDRANENQLETDIVNMIGSLQDYRSRNARYVNSHWEVSDIADPMAIGAIRRMFSFGKLLLNKYKETQAVEQVNNYLKIFTMYPTLNTDAAIENLELLSDLIAKHLGQDQQFKDKTFATFVWDKELSKKLEFPQLSQDEQAYYDAIKKDWRKLAWLITFYVVKCEGDAHILLSGPNLSGKTNTAICFLKQCNYYLVDYWKVKRYNETHTKEHPEDVGVLQRKFSIKKDVYVTPEASELQERFKSEQYQTIDINEGMEVATNTQSQKNDAVQMGVKRYTTRSYHNIVIWEYQVQKRPTAMMVEGMNFWFQKMRKKHFVLSLASTLIRKSDPYYFQELDKCRTENSISFWMRYLNPNYIKTFSAPRLKPRYKREFDLHYWRQKDKQAQALKVKTSRTKGYETMLEQIYTEINEKHTLSLIELSERLDELGYQDLDKKQFMRDYGKYKRVRLWENWGKKDEKQVGAIKNG